MDLILDVRGGEPPFEVAHKGIDQSHQAHVFGRILREVSLDRAALGQDAIVGEGSTSSDVQESSTPAPPGGYDVALDFIHVVPFDPACFDFLQDTATFGMAGEKAEELGSLFDQNRVIQVPLTYRVHPVG